MARLYLIPNKIGEEHYDLQFPSGLKDIISGITCFIVEDIRNARRFIRSICAEQNIDEIKFFELNKHTNPNDIAGFLKPIEEGRDVGLLSEAGVPCVADPGAVVVNLAHGKNVEVVPLTGPSSLLLTLMASGLNGQRFCFHGYLPIDRKERIQAIKQLEKDSKIKNETQIFIEAPYRNNQLLADILSVCNGETQLCLGIEIYNKDNIIKTYSVNTWKNQKTDLHKKMVVYVLMAI